MLALLAKDYPSEEEFQLLTGGQWYAVWEPSTTYDLTLNGNEGTVGSESTVVQKYTKNEDIIVPSNPFTRVYDADAGINYTFDHWCTNTADTGTKYYPGDTVTGGFSSNQTWYAIWKAPSYYNLSFNANGGSGSMASKKPSVDQDFTIPKNTFYRLGYTFDGWSDGEEHTYSDGGTIPANTYAATSSHTLSAQWKKKTNFDEIVEGGLDFALKGGQTATFEGLPPGTGYQVWEETPAGWKLAQQVDATGNIVTGGTSSAYFLNTLSATTSTYASITAKKTLDGGIPGGSTFTFALTPNSTTAEGMTVSQMPMPADSTSGTKTAACNSAGAVSFGTIEFTKAGTYVYEIKEVIPSTTDQAYDASIDYDDDTETVTVVVTEDPSTHALSAEVTYGSADGAVFENTHAPGGLKITKQITSEAGNRNTDFSFTLSLTKPGGSTPLVLTQEQLTNSGLTETTTEGTYTFTLKDTQSITISGLPCNTGYSVTETPPGGWSASCTDPNGTIPAGPAPKEVVWKNDYVPGRLGGTTAQLSVYKKMLGDTLTEGEFSFRLSKQDGANWTPLETRTNSAPDPAEEIQNEAGTGNIPNPWYGMGSVLFSEMSYAEPTTAIYRVEEDSTYNHQNSVDYSQQVFYAKVTVSDNNNGTLSSSVAWYSDEACETAITTAEPIFENSLRKAPLSVSKEVLDGPSGFENQEFPFTMMLHNGSGDAVTLSTEQLAAGTANQLSAVTDTPGSYSFTLKHGQTLTIPDLLYGTRYEVSEGIVEGYTQVSATGAAGEIVSDAGGAASFTNTGYIAGRTEVPFVKTYRGDDIAEDQFFIKIEQFNEPISDTSVPVSTFQYPVPAEKANSAQIATKRFNLPLTFDYSAVQGVQGATESGVPYYYRFTEVQGTGDVLYSQASYTGKVTVKDNEDGTLDVSPFVFDGGYREAAFTNIKLLKLTVDKSVTGNLGDRTKEFEFSFSVFELPTHSEYPEDLETDYTVTAPGGWTPDGGNAWTFHLAHGAETAITLPFGAEYSVSENAENYRPTLTIKKQDPTLLDQLITLATRTNTDSRSATVKEEQILSFTNRLNTPVPTGITAAGGGALALIGGAGWLGLRSRRKKREHEKETETASGGAHLRSGRAGKES